MHLGYVIYLTCLFLKSHFATLAPRQQLPDKRTLPNVTAWTPASPHWATASIAKVKAQEASGSIAEASRFRDIQRIGWNCLGLLGIWSCRWFRIGLVRIDFPTWIMFCFHRKHCRETTTCNALSYCEHWLCIFHWLGAKGGFMRGFFGHGLNICKRCKPGQPKIHCF
jgi:hypothetical protein